MGLLVFVLAIYLITYKKTRLAGIGLSVYFILSELYKGYVFSGFMHMVVDIFSVLCLGMALILLGRYKDNG